MRAHVYVENRLEMIDIFVKSNSDLLQVKSENCVPFLIGAFHGYNSNITINQFIHFDRV